MKKLLQVIVFSIILVACDARTVVNGVVTDSHGMPISSAKVWLVWNSWTSGVSVKVDGSFSIDLIHGPREKTYLVVGAEGYKTHIQPLEVNNGVIDNCKVVLESGNPKELISHP